MIAENHLLQSAEAYAKEILVNHSHGDLIFHTVDHTVQVVKTVEEIARESDLTEEEMKAVMIAAWFHDLGYTQIYEGHEQVSRQIAIDFLIEKEVDRKTIEMISGMIEATRLDVEPRNLYEKIIKDADLYNLSTPEALDYTGKLREEWETFCNRVFDDASWYRLNLDFFKKHVYYTDYAQKVFSVRKEKNIKLLEGKLQKAIKKEKEDNEGKEQQVETGNDKKAKRKELVKQLEKKDKQLTKLSAKVEKLKEQKPDRGIETMFRTTYRTHIALSGIADNKANILLSINALIISIVFTSLIRQLSDHPLLIFPAILLLSVCMATIIFAILATRPKVSSGIFTKEDIEEKRTNLLFFGNFHRMPLPDYQWGISEMMKDSEYLYGSMAKDIYFLGVVLAKKFQLLRIAYTIFMYGLLIVVVILGTTFWIESRGL